VEADSVLHFNLAQIVQLRLPLPIVRKIVCHPLRKKDVTPITAIHDSLGDVDAGACNIGLFVQVSDFIDGAAMNSHANVKFGMTLQRLCNLHRAQNRSFRTGAKDERSAVASWQS
jgi:hypothetical protein